MISIFKHLFNKIKYMGRPPVLTIRVSKDTWIKLSELKIELGKEKDKALTFDEVINVLIENYKKS